MTTFYKKVGKRYVAVNEFDSELSNSLQEGYHLVHVQPGSKSTRYNVNPNFVALIAAGVYFKEQVVKTIVKASELKPKSEPLTKEQIQAWNKLKESFNDSMFSLYASSANDIAEAGMNALIEEANKLLDNPSVKKAYEHFLLVCKLTTDER